MADYDLHRKAAAIVRDAGGHLVGRTRLQKVTYLAQLAGFAAEFSFEYHHYGPFSEDLAEAMQIASGLRLVQEEERPTTWGGWYSIYTCPDPLPDLPPQSGRAAFLADATKVSPLELELAATAAYLYAEEGIGRTKPGDPWAETARLKPDKAADGRLDRAKAGYRRLCLQPTPQPLPPIA